MVAKFVCVCFFFLFLSHLCCHFERITLYIFVDFTLLSFVSDQNFYYQSPQRFQPTFQNPRNGFFPSNGVPGVPPGLVGNLPRNPLGAYNQDQTFFGGEPSNEDTTSQYFQYSPFPVSSIDNFLKHFLPDRNLFSVFTPICFCLPNLR